MAADVRWNLIAVPLRRCARAFDPVQDKLLFMETGATTVIWEIFNHVSRVQKESPPLEASQMKEKLFFFFFWP